MNRLTNVAYWVVAVFLAVGFLPTGIGKLAQPDGWVTRFTGWGLPSWLVVVVAVVEALGGLLVLIPRAAPLGAAMIGTIMAGAIGTKVANGIAASAVVDVVLLGGAVALVVLWRRKRRSAAGPSGATEAAAP